MAVRLSGSIVSKEGFLYKKGGLIKSWSRRYFVLTPQSLCYFRSESHERLEPLGRIFLSDIVDISADSTEKKKAFVFVLTTKKRAVLLQGANNEDRDKWVESIKKAAEVDNEAENMDPFRKSLRRLTPGVKRITLFKDPGRGIGCTIKNTAGHIFVNRILEDGPIAETGVLRPGDEILDIHGVTVFGKSVADVVEIIKQCPTEFLATVRPIKSVQRALQNDYRKMNYSDIVHKPISNGNRLTTSNGSSDEKLYDSIECDEVRTAGNTSSTAPIVIGDSPDYAVVGANRNIVGRLEPSTKLPNDVFIPPPTSESPPSFEDVGNYDDEDEGDIPPPLPQWTEDALILVDPPPSQAKPKFNIYNTNAHLLPMKSGKCAYPGSPDRTVFGFGARKNKKSVQEENVSPLHSNSSSPNRRSPPNFPPPKPGQLHKCHSQDALDQIDSKRPPVPPRMKNPERGYRSPGAKPRIDHHKYDDVMYNRRAPLRTRPTHQHQYEDIEHKCKPDDAIKYADLSFSQRCVYSGR